MLNFLTNVFQEKSNARNICGNYDGETDAIQECMGCASECQFTCYSECADQCVGNSVDPGNSGGTPCADCNGSCFSLVSIVNGGK